MALLRAEKAVYNDHIKDLKLEKENRYKRITELEKKKKSSARIQGYYTVETVLELLKIILLDINMSDASVELLNFKNESTLKNARKEFHNVLQKMEQLLGDELDRSLKDNEDFLKAIDKINPQQMLKLIQRIHFIFSMLVEKIGETSKWKWSFVDLQARVTVIAKNMINFSDIQKYRDPRTEFYRERQELLSLCKSSLRDVAQLYRNKYEQSTKVPGDMLKSIEFLSVLRKIHMLFAESEEANKIKTTIEAMRTRLEADEKDEEKDKKTSKK